MSDSWCVPALEPNDLWLPPERRPPQWLGDAILTGRISLEPEPGTDWVQFRVGGAVAGPDDYIVRAPGGSIFVSKKL